MKLAFPTDEHYPFQDEAARTVALKIVADFDPDLRIAGSDGMDFYSLSKFDKNPSRIKVDLQAEIEAWQSGQRDWIDAAPNAEALWIPGNHEDRLRRWLWAHPSFYGLEALQWKNLLGFDALNITEAPGGSVDLFGKLLVKHGSVVRKNSAYTAMAELVNEFFAISTLSGHTHRGGVTYATTRNGVVQGVEGFCLCDLDPEYVVHPNWQQGIVLAEVTEQNMSIEPVHFNRFNGRVRAIWRGKEYVQ
jgi:hypothetical protein